jgi:hypothetical protein
MNTRNRQVQTSAIGTSKDLLHIVGRKLSNADINHSQLEDLFLETGILTTDKIVDVLG